MKKTFISFMLVLFVIFTGKESFAGDGYGISYGSKNTQQQLLDRNLETAKKEFAFKTGKLIDFYIDLQLGMGITNATVNSQPGTGSYATDSKAGLMTGALIYLSLFDAISFSTGLDFSNKSFKVTPPGVFNPVTQTIDSTQKEISNQYLNIPLNFNVGGMVGEKIGLTFNGGPYLGLRISTDDAAGLGYKDFDLGLNGTLTGSYLVAPFTSILLGTKLQYGGLNNLGKTANVESIRTTNFGFFTGVRFGL